MIPVVNASAAYKSIETPIAVALPKSSQPSPATPKLVTPPVKSTSPRLLSLNLKAVSNRSSPESDLPDRAPSSPSSRTKTKVERSITETRTNKRPIDGADGPGTTPERLHKRRKVAMSPGSTRGSTSPRKQMINHRER